MADRTSNRVNVLPWSGALAYPDGPTGEPNGDYLDEVQRNVGELVKHGGRVEAVLPLATPGDAVMVWVTPL